MNFDILIDSFIGYPITADYVRAALEGKEGEEVSVRICSLGGDVTTALDILALFRNHGNVTAYVQGMTASAATVIAMGARRVVMDRHALMLVHNSAAGIYIEGFKNRDEIATTISELEHIKQDAETIDRLIAGLYASRAKVPYEDLAALMSENRWLSAEEAMGIGLVDAIEEAAPRRQVNDVRRVLNRELVHFAACGLPAVPEAYAAPSEPRTFVDRFRAAFTKKDDDDVKDLKDLTPSEHEAPASFLNDLNVLKDPNVLNVLNVLKDLKDLKDLILFKDSKDLKDLIKSEIDSRGFITEASLDERLASFAPEEETTSFSAATAPFTYVPAEGSHVDLKRRLALIDSII